MNKFQFIIYFTLLMSVYSQNSYDLNVYIDVNDNKVTQFEKHIILNVINLMNKKEPDYYTIKYKPLDSFSEVFSKIDSSAKNETKDRSIAINEISYTAERALKYDFSMPYMINQYVFMSTLKIKIDNIKDVSNSNYVVGVIEGSVFEQILRQEKISNYSVYANTLELKNAIDREEIHIIFSDYTDSWVYNLGIIYAYKNAQIDKFCIMLPMKSELTEKLNTYLKYYLNSSLFYKYVKGHFGSEALTFFKKQSR